MNTKIRMWGRRPWQVMLAVLLAWLLPLGAWATHVDDAWKYQVTLNGANSVRIQVPVYDQDGADCWVCDGNLKVTIDGVERTCFHWQRNGDTDSDSKDIWIHFSTEVGGSFDITQGNSGNHFTMTKGGDYMRLIYRNNDGNTYTVYAVWTVPYEYLGKKMTFKWDVERDGNGRSKEKVSGLNDTEITMPAAQDVIHPQVTMATMSYSEAGKLELPWFMGSNKIRAVRYEYTDAYGFTVTQDLPVKENSGTIYLDATVPHDNFRLVVSYDDDEDYGIDNVGSTTQNLQMIHAPVGLKATPKGDRKAKVQLDWYVRYPATTDFSSNDLFEVQRSLTGQEADFVTIGSVPSTFDEKNPRFTYTDSTLVDALTAAHLAGGSSLPNLTYRVRRMITQSWGWNHNCAMSTQTTVSGLHLLRLKNYTATLTDERSYSVRVNWDYADEPNAVWDNRAKLMMVVTMRNNAGELVDTKTFELTEDERNARQKTIDLSRTCVKYDIRMYVDPGTSPLRSWDQPDAMRIKSVADWNTFRSKVQEAQGQYDVNAVLMADISTTASCGDNGYPYRGTFDGNGHTLTVNISTGNQYEAPFKFVKDATFRNLRTAGTISSNQKFIGGIAARTDGNVVIENCRSSVTVNNTGSGGDATNGGIVAVYGGGGQLTITDCLFDGSFTGSSCHSNGGFVGWSAGKVNIINCHFAPSKIETLYTASRTWARMSDYKNLTVTNSHFTKSYNETTSDLYVIRSKDDWTTFREAVINAKAKKDVNAVLDADLSLTADDVIGFVKNVWDTISYRGTFDGNGHTLNIDLDNSEYYFALFRDVIAGTTIKNLRMTGKVNCRDYVAALVGNCADSTDLNINHVFVSANVSARARSAAGLIGYVNKDCQIKVTDCLYEGKLTTVLYSPLTAGCFIGGTSTAKDRYDWHLTRVYERSSAEGPDKDHYGMNIWQGKNGESNGYYWTWSDNDCCLSSHDFKEVPENCRNITKPDTVLARMDASMPSQWEKDGSGNAVPIVGMTSARLLAALGPGWQTVSGAIVPKTATVSVNPSALSNFYHEGTGRISKNLMTQTRQSSVVLTWAVEDGVVDYFKVYRREVGTTDWGEPIATNIDKMGYEDTTVSPLKKYEYKVVAVADCEGLHTSETDVYEGACKNTGRVSGYVRMNDGTSVAGIEVEIAPSDTPEGEGKVTVTTNESGYFMADELSYYGGRSITYNVTPVGGDKIKLERGSMPVTFDDKTNDMQLPEFTITSGHRFSGYVMYEGTSIPVKGARFRVDDHDLHNAVGDYVETAYDGSFSFRVLGGTRRIQVTMDGHTFADDGYFKGKDGHYFSDDVAQIYFYDTKKVRLAGRVVGGDDQGRLPLENNLSRNNLGDDLTMVFTLEGDNTSWLVYDNQNPGLSQREDSIVHKGGKYKTKLTVQRKRMEVKPDPVTGEYELLLPPVRWKVQQVYCKGYATLFQDGQVSEVVDLTNCLTPRDSIYKGTYKDVDGQSIYQPHETANATFSRIYHAPVEITYKQLGYDTFSYFGDRTYAATTVGGTNAEVPLAYKGKVVAYKDSIVGYKDVIVGYKDAITGNTIEYDENETHTPKLTGTDGVYDTWSGNDGKTEFLYDYLFDGDLNTWWLKSVKHESAWVEFKTDKLVSVKQYTMTTVKYSGSRSGSCPKSWTLKARANETDEWATISAYEDGHMTDREVKAFTFDVADQGSYQYFRLEVTASNSIYEEPQLAELSLTCRGKEGTAPVPVYEPDPIVEKFPIAEGGVLYTFGYPVFSVGRKYPILISVGENYIYNNDTRAKKVDRVSVGGGTVTVHNGMKNGLDQEVVELDSLGQGIFNLAVEATPRLLSGKDALRTVTMTLTQDGTTYEAEPLQGYLLNAFSTGQGKDVLVADVPVLIDILRDPPGGGSSATLSKGSTLKYSYTLDLAVKAGFTLSWGTGTKLQNFQGTVVNAPSGSFTHGIVNDADTKQFIDMEYAFDMEGHKAFSYTMNVGQDISTSSEPGMVGANADLFIGTTQNLVVQPMSTIRAIPDNLYRQMKGQLGGGQTTIGNGQYTIDNSDFGTLVHIAEGRDDKDSLYHLVRDESIGYGPVVKSQFIHSQKHILTEVIPAKIKELRSLMFIGTEADAQAKANATKKPVYWTTLKPDTLIFGTEYKKIDPQGTGKTYDNEADKICQVIMAWVRMLATNEQEKLAATDLVANYDVDGATSVSYSEKFESDYTTSAYYYLPGIVQGEFFDDPGGDNAFATVVTAMPTLQNLAKLGWSQLGKNTQAVGTEHDHTQVLETSVNFAGTNYEFSLLPILEYNLKDVAGESKSYSRKESFNIAMNNLSHLNFDVYRVLTDTTTVKNMNQFDVFTNDNFFSTTKSVEKKMAGNIDLKNFRYPRGFVYRTRGGATCNPWENARYSLFNKPGQVIDERTKKIENPKITVDRQSVSGVPYGEAARFTIYLTNDSEDPEAANKTISQFSLYANDDTNPYGAKISVDGKPLDVNGRKIILSPGEVVTKVVEVTGGNSFDLEGLTIGIASNEDWRTIYDELSLDVHYLHQAGPVNIATPGDKWVMNTYAEKDDRGWFLPVTIDGFDRHQHNFDHIEFQYKETLRGDDAWTNLCSYYADSLLLKAASGERQMIPENGNIEAHFYGEGMVMEKAYDLRAVLYCRNGNSFLTTSSPIVSGVKDTRRPQLFGTPEPKDGIVKLGDNIIFNFTEDIEYNYLSAITNFEVKGEVNNQNVSEAVSLQFTGNGSVESEAQRNFSGKDLTIDLMIRPDETGRDMPIFSHGTNGKKLQLWLTGDRLLKAVVDDQTFVSDTAIVKGFTQVAMSISQADSTLTFYNGGKTIGQAKLTEAYNGTGPLIFGRTNESNRTKSQYYEGRMMEARVWYRAMTGGEVGTTYGSQRLTGYEPGLVDYYPMNEGTGDYALDHTQGANAQLKGASWAMPRGWSLRLDNEGVELKQQALSRTAEQDYTMMLWFKTSDAYGTLVSNSGGKKDEAGAENHFWIGFDDGQLAFRSNGQTHEVGSGYNDDQWHHYAMTVNRARGVANIYVDQTLRATFSPDSLGGISGGTPLIGGMMEYVKNTILTGATVTGNITESPYTYTGNGTQTNIPQQTAVVKNIVDLSTLTTDYEAQDGDALTDTLRANVKITITDGATVTLDGATIEGTNNSDYPWAGITCPGNATIFLNGENTVNGFYENYPGIYIAEGKTLTIRGNGSLTAFGDFAPGIGGGYTLECGNIVIEGGTINSCSRKQGTGIGSGHRSACGDITIKGGNITAKGGQASAGIGSASVASCGNITIMGGTINAHAHAYNSAGIGSGSSGSCGNITITGGTINAVGSEDGPGIGSGEHGSCGDITITNGVTSVTATKYERADNSIGAGNGGTVGTVTIGGNYIDTFETNIESDLTGNIDELCMFQQALPLTLIKAYATKSPQGDEAGLLTYLSFDRQERQKDNDIETVAYPWSKKIYLDDMGEVRYELDPVTKQATSTPVRDYVFVGSADEVLMHITNETAAPVVPYEELTNLKFSFAGKDNQVLVELDELTSRINRRNIYVTLRDVEDKNGNAMDSPQTACYYVTNSSLRWQNERANWLASYGYGEYIYFDIINNSATSHTYTIENCPRWLDMESYSGIIGPLGTLTIKGMVNKGLNVGTYDEIIYLTDEAGVSEPLYLNLTVTTSEPDWAWSVDGDLLKHSMNIAGQVYLNGDIDIDTRDIVGVFDRENRCHGIAHVSYSALTGEAGLYLTVYDSEPSGTELFFKLWQYSTGRELMLTADGNSTLTFSDKAVLGTDTPVRFEGGSQFVQTFDLAAGWNWVSFNVASERLFNLSTLLDGLPWKEGDVLTDMNSDATLIYRNDHWLVSGGASVTSLSQKNAYAIMVNEDIQFPIAGNIIKQLDMRTIELKPGWNGIGYTPMLNLSVETALSDYYDKAQPGDVIKSHDEFAYFTVSGGVGRWRGNLQYMKPGEGYMLLRKASTSTRFTYPFYEPGSTFLDEWPYSGSTRAAAPAHAKTTMSVSAVVEGFEVEEGDRLVAYANGEMAGATAAVSGKTADHTDPLYLSIGSDSQQGIWFAIERDGEIVASTNEQMTFTSNAVIGSPDEPTTINFVKTDRTDDKWYTVGGIPLPKRPTQQGVYIFNGKKIIIK